METPNGTVHELRVLAGPQAGAAIALALGATMDVGSLTAHGCQVALRDPLVGEQRLRLHVRPNGVRLEVLAGTVHMAGQRLSAPCAADWLPFVPVRVGQTVVAVGESESPRWAGVLALDAAPWVQPEGAAEAAPSAAALPEPAPVAAGAGEMGRRPEAWLAWGGGVLALMAFGLLAFVSVATPAKVQPSAAQRLERVLGAPEFRGLRVVALGVGEAVRVQGELLTLADRARLDRALAGARVDVQVDVRVGEQLTQAVRDVYRMNGVVVEAALPTTLAEVGVVRVQTQEADGARLQRIEAAVRHDVPGLQRLESTNTAPTPVPEITPMPDDPGKRIASIVPGETAYVVTVDGTRYFIGALLPSGHRIAAISESEVTLDLGGKLSPLKF